MTETAAQTTAGPEPLSKTYLPAQTEPRSWKRWMDAGAFHADPNRVLRGEADPYCILIPPPNVTAALHLGHALNNTIQDILTRAHRMKGFETLWMPGTDHAGIATQTVVDKRLREAGEPALADYKKMQLAGEDGQTKFVAKVQAFKDEYEQRITEQLHAMGCSCDWDRQRFTMDDVCKPAVREAFFQLFKDGLIYRGKRLVNWDPVTQTALSDDEVENHEVQGAFYYLRYPLVQPNGDNDHRPVTWDELAARGYPEADQHPEDEQAWVTVATTRPETYLGDTAVALNRRDPRAESLRGVLCELPLVGRCVPIIEDDYVVLPIKYGGDENDPKAQMATGFLKVTPAHDPNDYELGMRHADDIRARCTAGEHVINVMAPDASISKDHGWVDFEQYGHDSGAEVFVGLSREDARAKVVEEFKARSIGEGSLLEAVKPHTHTVGHSYRSHAAIEPYLSDQWYCKVTDDKLRGTAQRATKPEQRSEKSLENWNASRAGKNPHDGKLTFYPDRYAKTYETWHDNLRDWCISRQLWWGHRIPVWVSPANPDGSIGDTDSIAPVLQGVDTDRVFSQVFEDRTFVCFKDPGEDASVVAELEAAGFTQDPDVLDTWFSSALWPLSTMGWPNAEAAAKATEIEDFPELLAAFNPTSVLTTAREIITLWVSRMVMFNRYFLGDDQTAGQLPFKDVFIHAMIQDGEGRKMSKSLGNGVDPLDIIHSHGADAMRFTLCQMTTQTQDVRMPVEFDEGTGKNTSPKFDVGRNFCNKLWNAARFTLMMLEDHTPTPGLPIALADLSLTDRWMLSRLAATTDAIDAALKSYQFKDYADALYDLLWRDFCDWYLEAIKPTLSTDPNQPAVLRAVFDGVLRMLHPVAPFITEDIFERLAAIPSREIEGLSHATTKSTTTLCESGWPLTEPGLRDEVAEAAFTRAKALVTIIREVRAKSQVQPRRKITLHASDALAADFARWTPLIETLAGVETCTTEPAEGLSSAFTFEGVEHRLSNLADALDAGAEKERLAKRLAELDKSIGALEGRLNNPGYADKAPAKLVDQTRQQLADLQAERGTVAEAMGKLG
ncbi:MAG: valyl-tRNA synthetase [Phycisphaerales bacterium]|jgi:valyl-tRNA synthetase